MDALQAGLVQVQCSALVQVQLDRNLTLARSEVPAAAKFRSKVLKITRVGIGITGTSVLNLLFSDRYKWIQATRSKLGLLEI